MTRKYIYSLKFLIKNKWVAVGGLVLITAISVFLIKKAPSGFIPTEDQGFVLYAVNTPPGSSLERTHRATEEIDKIVKKENATNHLWVADGLNFISNANASPYSAGFIRLKDIDKRGDMKDPDQIAAALTGKVSAVKMLMHSSSTFLLYKVLVTSVVSNLCCRTELTALSSN